MAKDLAKEVSELSKRINELEKMLSSLIKPLSDAQKTTAQYLRLTAILLDNGGLTPDLILPELKDTISQDIVRVLLERSDQNISQITELVKSKRGTASRRIIRQKLILLEEKQVVHKKEKGRRAVYSLTPEVITKWTQLLGLSK